MSDIKTERKNPDYTASAVNLYREYQPGDDNPHTMPTEIVTQQERLTTLAALTRQLDEAVMRLGETPEALALKAAQEALEDTVESREAKELQDAIVKLKADIAITMKDFGYQDVERGWYALYQKRITDTYSPELVKANLPKQAPLLIEETVNKTAIEGLIKGKLITQEQADSCIDLTKRKEVLVPIIKVA
jgi:hypothetical protein